MLEFRRLDGKPLPKNPDHSPVGWLPQFLDEDDPRPARDQIDANYQEGGGWRPIEGFQFTGDNDGTLSYPGDPLLKPIAAAKLRDEFLVFYPHSLLVIIQEADRSFEVARVD
jgi:hypothetical protein